MLWSLTCKYVSVGATIRWMTLQHNFSMIDAFLFDSLFVSLLCTVFTLLCTVFTLNVRILGEVQPAELIDRGEKSDFFKSPKKISKNDVSSVQENSKNVANASTASDIELVIFLSTIFPWPGMDLPAARELKLCKSICLYSLIYQKCTPLTEFNLFKK